MRACLVGCGSKKSDNKDYCWRLYESSYFKQKFSAAMSLGKPYVISAEYGLLSPVDSIEPYDTVISELSESEKRVWAKEILSNLPQSYEEVFVFAGKDYVEPLTDISHRYRYNLVPVFQRVGTSGIGEQISVSKKLASDNKVEERKEILQSIN